VLLNDVLASSTASATTATTTTSSSTTTTTTGQSRAMTLTAAQFQSVAQDVATTEVLFAPNSAGVSPIDATVSVATSQCGSTQPSPCMTRFAAGLAGQGSTAADIPSLASTLARGQCQAALEGLSQVMARAVQAAAISARRERRRRCAPSGRRLDRTWPRT
jgi:hypothetical protein